MNWLDVFSNMLKPWQWAVLAAIPPAIVLLYFLKLRREPLEVPSTYLWHRTVEDLHVNSIWQKLRQNLLLCLQLLLIALLMLACLRPNWRGNKLTGDRFIFLVDASASMSATDVKPSRLEAAKQQVDNLIEQMKSGDVAMIVSFSDRAQVEQPYTDNRRLLRRKLAAISPTERTSDMGEALRVAAGLANPGRSGDAAQGDVAAADAMLADLFIFTDGGFRSVPKFSMGNLRPIYVPFGQPDAANVSIAAFSTGKSQVQPEKMQAYARLENHTDQTQSVEAALYFNGSLIDANNIEIPANGNGGVEFLLDDVEEGTLKIELQQQDDLAIDNVAYAPVNMPRRAKVLFVTPANDGLETALSTDASLKLADVSTAEPAALEGKEYNEQADSGAYDLIVYDQCAPKTMPQANTLTIGRVPPASGWTAGEKQDLPQIIDADRAHPLMQFVEMGDVTIVQGTPLETPSGGTVLIDSDIGTLLAVAPREGFEDAVIGFEIVGTNQDGQRVANTDWTIRLSFPLFIKNVLEYLGGSRSVEALASVQPGQQISLRTSAPVKDVTVTSPSNEKTTVARSTQNTFIFGKTDAVGIYEVAEGNQNQPAQRFAVNLFDSTESDIRPREMIETEYQQIAGTTGWETTRRETWKWIILAGLVVLLVEWYVYNRRVYL